MLFLPRAPPSVGRGFRPGCSATHAAEGVPRRVDEHFSRAVGPPSGARHCLSLPRDTSDREGWIRPQKTGLRSHRRRGQADLSPIGARCPAISTALDGQTDAIVSRARGRLRSRRASVVMLPNGFLGTPARRHWVVRLCEPGRSDHIVNRFSGIRHKLLYSPEYFLDINGFGYESVYPKFAIVVLVDNVAVARNQQHGDRASQRC